MNQRRGARLVFVAGTFDGLHDGHRDYFRQARACGETLVVVVARDSTVERVKGHRPQRTEADRLAAVAAEPLVDHAILGNEGADRYAIVLKLRPDVIVLGYDQEVRESELRARLDGGGLQHTAILRAQAHHPEVYKSSLFRHASRSM